VSAFDVPTYAAAVGALAVVAALASSIPAWRAARAEPGRALRDG
jgi:ABC-type lipoprotein release transport system permease subunit